MADDDGRLSIDERRRAAQDLARQTLAQREAGSIVVSDATQSMAPLLHGGEVLHWRKPALGPRRGELVIFPSPVGLVVHRLVGFAPGGGLRTKGDNRPAPDVEIVAPGAVIGVVEAIERPNEVRRLTGAAPRAYALLVLGWSLLGAAVHGAAEALDGVARRLRPRQGDRRIARRPAWWVQRVGLRIIDALLFRSCHPVVGAEER